MSKFTEKPYIETILAELSGENKVKLLNFINGKSADASDDVSYTLCTSASAMAGLSAGVHAVAYNFNSIITWKGYFIRTTNYKTFITFKNGIDLWLATIYKNDGSSLIPMEKCTSDNIRALLREDAYIDSSELPTPGTVVEANPTLSGNEASLTGVKIGDTKYVLGGGTNIYKHSIVDANYNELTFLSVSNTQFTAIDIPFQFWNGNIWQLYFYDDTSSGKGLVVGINSSGKYIAVNSSTTLAAHTLGTIKTYTITEL